MIEGIKPSHLIMIQTSVLTLVNDMIKYQGLEKTLEDIRNLLDTGVQAGVLRDIPKEMTEETWRVMINTTKKIYEKTGLAMKEKEKDATP